MASIMKRIIKKWINGFLIKAFGLKLYSVSAHGREDLTDIRRNGYAIKTIFDVGANHGQSVEKFLSGFPKANIFAFEPVTKTYRNLAQKYHRVSNVKLFQLALGKAQGTQLIYIPQYDSMASLVKPENFSESETVPVNTIDIFCYEKGIKNIDLLKIDAEGYDLEVLKGAESMLEQRKIKLILVELGFDLKSSYHLSFDLVRDFLFSYDFALYGFYDQQLDWSGKKKIRYANVCFRLSDTTTETD